MGEQANYFLQDVLEMENLRDEWQQGFMDLEDAYDQGIIDEMGYQEFD